MEREHLYNLIVRNCRIGFVRVIITEVNGYDEESSQFVEYNNGIFKITDSDGYSCELSSDEEMISVFRDLENDHYSIVQVDRTRIWLEWEEHEEMNNKDLPIIRENGLMPIKDIRLLF